MKRKLSLSDEADSCHLAKKSVVKAVECSELDDKTLWTICNEYDTLDDWKLLAKCLGLGNQDILLIEHKYNDLLECFYQMLIRWRLRQPENCNLNFLLKVINQKFGKSIYWDKKKDAQIYFNFLAEKKSIDNIKLNEKILWIASDFMCENWKSIGRYLGIKESTLIQIETKYLFKDGLRECCYQMMLIWSQQFNSEAFIKNLSIKLIDMDFSFYAKKLLENF